MAWNCLPEIQASFGVWFKMHIISETEQDDKASGQGKKMAKKPAAGAGKYTKILQKCTKIR